MIRSAGYTGVPLSFNRRMVIASASVTKEKNTIHCVTEVDVSEPRRLLKEYYEKRGEKLSFTGYIVACLARAVGEDPRFNAFIKGRRLIIPEDVTVSVLVERESEGEKFPEPAAIQKAQKKNLIEIHHEIREAQKEQDDRLGSLSGQTWVRMIPPFLMKMFVRMADRSIAMGIRYGKTAVTAMGMYGKEAVWFIPHGSATVLLSVGSIVNRITETDGRFESREHLCLTVSFDHDIIDGAPAARFMQRLSDIIKSGDIVKEIMDKD
jgi:pyruvate/2-oxoglutarate dehydrogenase complex dihydrolipoamide acyltransferase (E2) component